MLEIWEVDIKREDGFWETKKTFEHSEEGSALAMQYADSLMKDGHKVSITASKLKTEEEIVEDFTKLLLESTKLSQITGEDCLMKAITSMRLSGNSDEI